MFRILACLLIIGLNLKAEAKVQRHSIEAETARLLSGASVVTDNESSKGYLVNLAKPGQGVQFTKLKAGSKLAIRYASLTAGTINVAVNDQLPRKVNIHSSGKLTGSFLFAIIDIEIPVRATLTVSLSDNNVEVNIDKIILGNDDLKLPPDIWNLPALPVAAGPYPADWKGIEPDLYRSTMVA